MKASTYNIKIIDIILINILSDEFIHSNTHLKFVKSMCGDEFIRSNIYLKFVKSMCGEHTKKQLITTKIVLEWQLVFFFSEN